VPEQQSAFSNQHSAREHFWLKGHSNMGMASNRLTGYSKLGMAGRQSTPSKIPEAGPAR